MQRLTLQMLSAAGCIQIWQRRPLAMVPICALLGELVQMWFALAWHRWRNLAVGRLRLKCMVGAHLARCSMGTLELAFKGWRKVAELRVALRSRAVQTAKVRRCSGWRAVLCCAVVWCRELHVPFQRPGGDKNAQPQKTSHLCARGSLT